MGASTFPTSYDTFHDPTSTTLTNAAPFQHAANHTLANDAALALEQRVGIVGATSVPLMAQAVSVSNISLSGTPTINGYATSAGDRVLLVAQSTASQNGVWTVAAGAWARPVEFATGANVRGAICLVQDGSLWVLPSTSTVTVDTTSQSWDDFLGTVATQPNSAKVNLMDAGYLTMSAYLSGTDIHTAIQAYYTDVIAGNISPNLYFPNTMKSSYSGGYTAGTSPPGFLWDGPVYYDAPGPEQNITITFDPQCFFYLGSNLANQTVSGNTTGLFALHLNESSSSPSYSLYGMRSTITGGGSSTYSGAEASISASTSSVTRRFIINRPNCSAIQSAKSSLFSPSFVVCNTIGARINDGTGNNIQYMMMTVGYTDAVDIDGLHWRNPLNAGVSTKGDTYGGEGCFLRMCDDGDAVTLKNPQGGSSALVGWFTNGRGIKIKAPVGGAYIFESCSATIEELHWDGDQPTALAPTLIANHYIIASDVKIVGGWWHRSKLEQCTHQGATTPVYPFMIDDNASGQTHNPSTLIFENMTVHANMEPISGTDTAVPDVYINSKQEGTTVVFRGGQGHAPHVTGTSSRLGPTVGAANSTLNTNLTTRGIEALLASYDARIQCVGTAQVVQARKADSSVPLPQALNAPGTTSVAVMQAADIDQGGNYTPGSSGVVTGGNSGLPTKCGIIVAQQWYAWCFDDGFGGTTPYQTGTANPSAAGLSLSNQGAWSSGTTYTTNQYAQYVPANANGGSGQTGSLTTFNFYVPSTSPTVGTAPCNGTGHTNTHWSYVPQANTITISNWTAPGPCVLRIWKSATSANAAAGIGANPDVYAEIAVSGPSTFVDLGNTIDCVLWQTWSSGFGTASTVSTLGVGSANGTEGGVTLAAARTDSTSVSYTTGSVIADPNVALTDRGQPVTGANIPVGAYVRDVVAGVSLTLSSAPTGSGTSVTVGGNQTVGTSTTQTVLAVQLQTGTFDVDMSANCSSTGSPTEIQFVADTGAFTAVSGWTANEAQVGTANGIPVAVSPKVKVTTPGWFLLQVHNASGANALTVNASTVSASKAGCTAIRATMKAVG